MADMRGENPNRELREAGDVQPVTGRPIWVWILVVLFIIGLVWLGYWIWGGHRRWVGGNIKPVSQSAPLLPAAHTSTVALARVPVLHSSRNQLAIGNVAVIAVPSHSTFVTSSSNSAA